MNNKEMAAWKKQCWKKAGGRLMGVSMWITRNLQDIYWIGSNSVHWKLAPGGDVNGAPRPAPPPDAHLNLDKFRPPRDGLKTRLPSHLSPARQRLRIGRIKNRRPRSSSLGSSCNHPLGCPGGRPLARPCGGCLFPGNPSQRGGASRAPNLQNLAASGRSLGARPEYERIIAGSRNRARKLPKSPS